MSLVRFLTKASAAEALHSVPLLDPWREVLAAWGRV